MKITATGVKGQDRKPFRRTFGSHDQMMAWADRNEAEILEATEDNQNSDRDRRAA